MSNKIILGSVLAILGSALLSACGDQAPATMVAVDPQTAKFVTPPGLPECAQMTVLSGDPAKGPAVILAKLASGCTVPWHWHTAVETLMVVSGRGKLEMRDGAAFDFKPGAYLSMPSKHVHQARCQSACMMFISASAAFDVHYVDDQGQEIPAADALKPPASGKSKK